MVATLSCPTCSAELAAQDEGTFRCQEDHDYTVVGLALTTNIAALRAIWAAIRALEDDASALSYMAERYGDHFGLSATARRAEAQAARDAANVLREHAQRAQKRLDALPSAPSSVGENGSQRGRGG